MSELSELEEKLFSVETKERNLPEIFNPSQLFYKDVNLVDRPSSLEKYFPKKNRKNYHHHKHGDSCGKNCQHSEKEEEKDEESRKFSYLFLQTRNYFSSREVNGKKFSVEPTFSSNLSTGLPTGTRIKFHFSN
jgi:hypothetical protein